MLSNILNTIQNFLQNPLVFYIAGGVGFVLCIVSIVLTGIFHANYKPKRIPLILFAVGFVLFMGTGFAHWFINNLPEEEEQVVELVGTTVDSGLLNADVTLPAFLFRDKDMSDFDGEAYAEKNDYKKATLNEDGSVTVKMSKGRLKEIVEEKALKLEETLTGLTGGADTPYVKSAIWTKNYDEIIITVDRAGYEEASGSPASGVGLAVATYQVYNGDYLYSRVIVRDVDTGNDLSDEVYPDVWE